MPKEPTQGEEFDWEETFKEIKRILNTSKEDKSKLHNCASMCVKYLEQMRELESQLATANQEIKDLESTVKDIESANKDYAKRFEKAVVEIALLKGKLEEIRKVIGKFGKTKSVDPCQHFFTELVNILPSPKEEKKI